MNDYDKAINYFKQSLEIGKRIGDRKRESWCYLFLGDVEFLSHQYNKAISCLKQSLEIAKEINDKPLMIIAYRQIGLNLAKTNSPVEACEYLEKSIRLSESIGTTIVEEEYKIRYYGFSVDVYGLLIILLIILNRNEEALQYVERSKSKTLIELLSTREVKPAPRTLPKKITKLIAKENELIQNRRKIQLKRVLTSNANYTITEETKPSNKTDTRYASKEIQSISEKLDQIYLKLAKYDIMLEYVSLRRPKPILMPEPKAMIE